jgi:hypothetical protein
VSASAPALMFLCKRLETALKERGATITYWVVPSGLQARSYGFLAALMTGVKTWSQRLPGASAAGGLHIFALLGLGGAQPFGAGVTVFSMARY